MTFDWLDKEKPAQRPWRGLPYNRVLNSGDLRWFPTLVWGRWRDRPKDETAKDAFRRVFAMLHG